MERMFSIPYRPATAKFREDQIARIDTWAGVPDNERIAASMHSIRVIPKNASTETRINPLDPAPDCGSWNENPDAAYGTVVPAGRL